MRAGFIGLGTMGASMALNLQAGEHEVAVNDLLNQGRLATAERERDGHRIVVPALRVGRFEIWGATAMVLAEFLVLLDWDPQLS